MRSSNLNLFGARRYELGRRRARFLGLGFGRADLDMTVDFRAILDDEAARDHVSPGAPGGADLHALPAMQISLHVSLNHNFPRHDVGGNPAVCTDGDPPFRNADFPLNIAIDKQIVRTRDFPFDG